MNTLQFPVGDPLHFFLRLGPTERMVSLCTVDDWTVIAWNPVRTHTTFADAKRAYLRRSRQSRGSLPFHAGLIGYMGYDAGCAALGVRTHAGHDPNIPGICIHEYDNAVLIRGTQLCIAGDATFAKTVRAILRRPLPSLNAERAPIFRPRSNRAWYRRAFANAQRCIRDGEFYQVNLAQRFDAGAPEDCRLFFSRLAYRHPAACQAFFESAGCTLLSLSPETFVRVRGKSVYTAPIKGTRPRGETPKQDAAMRRELLGSEKERAELAMITDLLRNDLGQVCIPGSVRVSQRRAVQANPTVWHTYSVIQGKLARNVGPLDAIERMLPAGSVTGCPKRRAVEEIDRMEPIARGPYTGVLLTLSDDGALSSSVLIRTIVARSTTMSLSVGGGIVADSGCQEEYEETLAKARTFLCAGSAIGVTRINGLQAQRTDSRLQLLQPLKARGNAVFETLRTYNGRVFELAAHCRRLRASANLLGLRLPIPLEKIGDTIRAAACFCGPEPLRIKVVVTKRDVLLHVAPLIDRPEIYRGVRAMFVRAERHTPQAKALPYDVSARAHARAAKYDCEEALLLAPDGCVPEGAYSNLFWVRGGILHTANDRVLLGITRSVVLQCARNLEVPVRYALATKNDLLHADEVFLTKTTTGPIPVIRIGDVPIGTGKPGVVTKRIMRAFDSYSGCR